MYFFKSAVYFPNYLWEKFVSATRLRLQWIVLSVHYVKKFQGFKHNLQMLFSSRKTLQRIHREKNPKETENLYVRRSANNYIQAFLLPWQMWADCYSWQRKKKNFKISSLVHYEQKVAQYFLFENRLFVKFSLPCEEHVSHPTVKIIGVFDKNLTRLWKPW